MGDWSDAWMILALLAGIAAGLSVSMAVFGGLAAGALARLVDPDTWHLFGYLFPRRLRARVFEPAFNDILADYALVRVEFNTPAARTWLTFCFTVRMVLLVVQCFHVAMVSILFGFYQNLLRPFGSDRDA